MICWDCQIISVLAIFPSGYYNEHVYSIHVFMIRQSDLMNHVGWSLRYLTSA
uniref:Uncharacterized protein n=1 Tax=Rhizophora mucronata TaxID=61149 RepID=A0A2P2Q5Q7_RHIMU